MPWYTRWYLRPLWGALALVAVLAILTAAGMLIFWGGPTEADPHASASELYFFLVLPGLGVPAALIGAGFAMYFTRPRRRPTSGWYLDPWSADQFRYYDVQHGWTGWAA